MQSPAHRTAFEEGFGSKSSAASGAATAAYPGSFRWASNNNSNYNDMASQ